MSSQNANNIDNTSVVFTDPVAYLAQFGIDAALIAETSRPVAA